jgi:hypothetical protein
MGKTLTYDEAVTFLPSGEKIHTFLGGLGADWKRESILAALKAAPEIVATNELAQRMGHGMAILHENGHWLGIATIRRTDQPVKV